MKIYSSCARETRASGIISFWFYFLFYSHENLDSLLLFSTRPPWRNITNFWLKRRYHWFLTKALQWKSIGILNFEGYSFHWWHWKTNSCTKNCILVLWSEWCGHISIFLFISRENYNKNNMSQNFMRIFFVVISDLVVHWKL